MNINGSGTSMAAIAGGMAFTVRAKDGVLTRYAYARPLHKARCMDLNQSVVTLWNSSNDFVFDASRVVFRPDCLGERHIVRDSYTTHVLVSDALKTALMATGDKGLNFAPPEILDY